MITRTVAAVVLALAASVAGAAQPYLGVTTGVTASEFSDCTGDCVYLQTDPDNDVLLGIRGGVEFPDVLPFGIGIGIDVAFTQSLNQNVVQRLIDGTVRVIKPIGNYSIYAGYGAGRQHIDIPMASSVKMNTPVLVTGIDRKLSVSTSLVFEYKHGSDDVHGKPITAPSFQFGWESYTIGVIHRF